MSLQKSLDSDSTERHDWDSVEILRLYELPLNDLLFQAQTIHRQYFDPNSIQVSEDSQYKRHFSKKRQVW
jgi:biotin synthase